jgi:hypothetical protein
MERAVQSTVLDVTRNQEAKMAEESGIELSLSEDDVKQYLDEVLKEIRDKQKWHKK